MERPRINRQDGTNCDDSDQTRVPEEGWRVRGRRREGERGKSGQKVEGKRGKGGEHGQIE